MHKDASRTRGSVSFFLYCLVSFAGSLAVHILNADFDDTLRWISVFEVVILLLLLCYSLYSLVVPTVAIRMLAPKSPGVAASIERAPRHADDPDEAAPELTANFFSYYTFAYMNPLLNVGQHRQLRA